MKILAGKEKEYADWKAKNEDDPYGLEIFRYAEAWADMMEEKLGEGAKLEDIAKDTSHQANTAGLTGFMYGAAVSVLSHCWEHGEQLRHWHNLSTQIKNEGDEANKKDGAVLNPAVLSVG
jgi:hypothetical protein